MSTNNQMLRHQSATGQDKLVELPSESFQAGNRSGVGISHSTTRNIRAAAKRKTQFGENLLTAISYLQQSIAREDA